MRTRQHPPYDLRLDLGRRREPFKDLPRKTFARLGGFQARIEAKVAEIGHGAEHGVAHADIRGDVKGRQGEAVHRGRVLVQCLAVLGRFAGEERVEGDRIALGDLATEPLNACGSLLLGACVDG